MARKPRDYKAEYARSKARANKQGLSERQVKRLRKELKTPRNASPAPQRVLTRTAPRELKAATVNLGKLRRESKAWSKAHSRQETSEYIDSFTPSQLVAYHAATVGAKQYAGPGADKKIKGNWKDYLVDEMGFYDLEEFKRLYT